MLRKIFPVCTIVLGALLGAGCGGGDDDSDGSNGGGGNEPGPSRGELLEAPLLVRTVTTSELLTNLNEPVNQALLLQAGAPLCDIAVYRIEYATLGGRAEETDASAALMAPTGAGTRCTGARPIVLYAHGTSTDREYDLTDIDDAQNAEGLLLAAFFAAQGFIVVAPNYTGYDTSTLDYHPYLVADAQAADMIDALVAARSAMPVSGATATTDDGRLYVTGYSQGGHVAMATLRALEADGQPVAAAAPMSGPYALGAFVDAVFAGRVNGGATVLGSYLFTSYQRVYGDVYSEPAEMFEAQYADEIETLFPSTGPRSQLYDEGKLPRDAFFSLEPPDPAFADITPPSSPEEFVPLFERGFAASDFLIRNAYRLAYLQDMAAHPDGFWPDTTDAAPPDAPQLPLRQALVLNDLRNFTPRSPTLLCGGQDDPTVYWLNTQAMQAYWASQPAGAAVTVLDVDAAASGNDDPYADLKQRFAVAKDLVAAQAVAGGATDGGWEAVLENYHAGLVAPFCLEAAQEFFEAH
ncbi:MAG TPA: hypothetical protein VFX69_02225 [Steroidobacteraceae bacterium]|nr:hypothetical protein [Steroidobacteraceae bacterium]